MEEWNLSGEFKGAGDRVWRVGSEGWVVVWWWLEVWWRGGVVVVKSWVLKHGGCGGMRVWGYEGGVALSRQTERFDLLRGVHVCA